MKNDHYKIVGVVVLVLVGLSAVLNKQFLLYIALGLGGLAYSWEPFAKTFAHWWMKFGKLLGNINGTLLLGVFFFLLLAPLAIIRKLLRKGGESKASTWVKSEGEVDFTKPW